LSTASKRKKLDSNNYDYTKRNDYSKGNDKKYCFRDKKKKKFQKILS
jgi:hypothetical protein